MTKAEASFRRANTLYHGAIKVFFAFAFIVLCLIAIQVWDLRGNFIRSQEQEFAQRDEDTAAARERLAEALEETNRQQIVTQNYIRCVASVLLKPISERSETDFNNCGIPGVTDPSKLGHPNTNQGETAPNRQTPAVTPQVESGQAPRNQPTTGEPPEEEPPTPDDRSALGRLPLIGGLLDAIGL